MRPVYAHPIRQRSRPWSMKYVSPYPRCVIWRLYFYFPMQGFRDVNTVKWQWQIRILGMDYLKDWNTATSLPISCSNWTFPIGQPVSTQDELSLLQSWQPKIQNLSLPNQFRSGVTAVPSMPKFMPKTELGWHSRHTDADIATARSGFLTAREPSPVIIGTIEPSPNTRTTPWIVLHI